MNHANGSADPYTFVRGGPELRFTELTQYRGKVLPPTILSLLYHPMGYRLFVSHCWLFLCLMAQTARIVSGFEHLEVLKTCGSAFKNFNRWYVYVCAWRFLLRIS
jgi:hypothetical protein